MIGVLVNVINFFILGGHDHGHHGHSHGHSHGHGHHDHDHHDHDDHDHDHHDHDHHDHDHDNHHNHHGKGALFLAAHLQLSCSSPPNPGGEGNLNLRSAVVHVLGDMVQSLGVAVAGALIWWKRDDPRFTVR